MCIPGLNGEGELRRQPANPGSPGKMAVKMECVCVSLTIGYFGGELLTLSSALCCKLNCVLDLMYTYVPKMRGMPMKELLLL